MREKKGEEQKIGQFLGHFLKISALFLFNCYLNGREKKIMRK